MAFRIECLKNTIDSMFMLETNPIKCVFQPNTSRLVLRHLNAVARKQGRALRPVIADASESSDVFVKEELLEKITVTVKQNDISEESLLEVTITFFFHTLTGTLGDLLTFLKRNFEK